MPPVPVDPAAPPLPLPPQPPPTIPDARSKERKPSQEKGRRNDAFSSERTLSSVG
jgi:hypothetical protein